MRKPWNQTASFTCIKTKRKTSGRAFRPWSPTSFRNDRNRSKTLHISGVIYSTLFVTSIYEDRDGILSIGSMGGLNRIDRRSGKNIASPNIGNEMLAILEDRQGVLFGGTFHEGLKHIDRETGKVTPYSPQSGRWIITTDTAILSRPQVPFVIVNQSHNRIGVMIRYVHA